MSIGPGYGRPVNGGVSGEACGKAAAACIDGVARYKDARIAELEEEVALLRGLFSIIDGMVDGRDENGPIGPKKPYSWESVAMVAFDCAYAALTPNASGKGPAL